MRYFLVLKKMNWSMTEATEVYKVETTPQVPPIYAEDTTVSFRAGETHKVRDLKVIMTDDIIKHIYYID